MTSFSLSRNAWGKLVLKDATGHEHADVFAIRLYPITDPNHWIALCDGRGRELLTIETLDELPPAIRQILDEELRQRSFIPVITQVHHISSLSEPCEWDVETDRGRTRFVLRSEDDVHRLSPYRAIIVDARGIRFLIRDVRELDPASRRRVEWYL